MQGTRFLSAFIKVNPYLTAAIAVGFTSVAVFGVKHADNLTFAKLIPLHIKSDFSDPPPDVIVDEVPDIEQANQIIHDLSIWSGGLPALTDDHVTNLLSTLPRPPDDKPWQDRTLARVANPFAPGFREADAGAAKADLFLGDPNWAPSSRSLNAPSSPGYGQRYSASAPFPLPPASGIRPVVPNVRPGPPIHHTTTPLAIQQFPLLILPVISSGPSQTPGIPPDGLPPSGPTRGQSQGPQPVPEPPAGVIFAGMLAMLAALRFRGGKAARH